MTNEQFQTNARFCPSCGTPLAAEALFCGHCGKRLDAEASVAPTPPPEPVEVPVAVPVIRRPKKKADVKKIGGIVRASLLVALSLLMCIFSFLPIFTYEVDVEELMGVNVGIDEEMKASFSPIDTVVFLFDSFHSETMEELEDSELNEQLEETGDDLFEWITIDYDEDEGIDAEGHALFQKFIKLSFRLSARSEDSPFSVDLLLCAILSIVYMLLGVALFVFSVLRLLGTVLPVKLGFEKTLRRLLCAVMPVVLLHRVALSVVLDDYAAEYFVRSGSGFAYWVLALSLIGVLILMLEKLILEGKRPKISHIIKASVSLVLIIVALSVSFAPMLTGAVNVEFSNKEKKTELKKGLPLGYFTVLSVVGDAEDEEVKDVEYYEEWFESGKTAMQDDLYAQLNGFEDYTTGEFKKGAANGHHVEFLTQLSMSGGSPSAMGIFSLVTLVYYLAIACLLLLLWRDLLFFATLDGAKPTALIEKILAGVFTVASFALTLVFIFIVKNRITYFGIGTTYGFGIGAGAITFLIFSILAIACPTARVKKAKTPPTLPVEPAEATDTESAEVAI